MYTYKNYLNCSKSLLHIYIYLFSTFVAYTAAIVFAWISYQMNLPVNMTMVNFLSEHHK